MWVVITHNTFTLLILILSHIMDKMFIIIPFPILKQNYLLFQIVCYIYNTLFIPLVSYRKSWLVCFNVVYYYLQFLYLITIFFLIYCETKIYVYFCQGDTAMLYWKENYRRDVWDIHAADFLQTKYTTVYILEQFVSDVSWIMIYIIDLINIW